MLLRITFSCPFALFRVATREHTLCGLRPNKTRSILQDFSAKNQSEFGTEPFIKIKLFYAITLFAYSSSEITVITPFDASTIR